MCSSLRTSRSAVKVRLDLSCDIFHFNTYVVHVGCSTRHYYGRPAWQVSYVERCTMVLQRSSLSQAALMGLFEFDFVLSVAKFTTCGCEKCIASVASESQLVDRWLKTLMGKMKEAEDGVNF